MHNFILDHFAEIFFGLLSAGALGFCKYLYSKVKIYKKMLEEKSNEKVNSTIELKLEPILQEIESLRKYIRNTDKIESDRLNLILSSYRFRLIQLCKEYIRQGYMTDEQYEQLSEFHKVYEGLGGNGQAKEYYDMTLKLEIRDK